MSTIQWAGSGLFFNHPKLSAMISDKDETMLSHNISFEVSLHRPQVGRKGACENNLSLHTGKGKCPEVKCNLPYILCFCRWRNSGMPVMVSRLCCSFTANSTSTKYWFWWNILLPLQVRIGSPHVQQQNVHRSWSVMSCCPHTPLAVGWGHPIPLPLRGNQHYGR